jgi:RHS repeat-associated protein
MIAIGADVPSQRAFSSSLPPPASSLCQTGGSVVFVQMDQQTIADYPVGGAATTPTFRYVYASYIDEPVVRKGPTSTSTVHFYHRNHQYSVTAVTTSTGAVAERYAYTAYGQPTILNTSGTPLSPQTSTLNSRYSYTGREWDSTLGLHHFRARWMSPSAGRFLGRDPIGYEGSEWGLYEYLRAGVTVEMDPMGLEGPPHIRTSGGMLIKPFPGQYCPPEYEDSLTTCLKSLCCPTAKCGNCLQQAEQIGRELAIWYCKNKPSPPDRCQKFMDGTQGTIGNYPCFRIEQFYIDNPWPLPNHTGNLIWVEGCAIIKKIHLGVFGSPICESV